MQPDIGLVFQASTFTFSPCLDLANINQIQMYTCVRPVHNF